MQRIAQIRRRSYSRTQEQKAPSDVVTEAVRNVLQATTPEATKTALNPLRNVVLSGKYSAQQLIESRVCEACTKAIPVAPSDALELIEYFYESESRIAMYNTPGFRENVSKEAMKGNLMALLMMWNMSDVEALAYSIVTIPDFVHSMLTICSSSKDELALRALSILRNLSMFPEAQPELLKNPTIIDDLLSLTERGQLATKATMALANLVGKDEIRSELLRTAKKDVLKSIVRILEECLDYEESSFALYEPLLSLRYLSIPQKNRTILGPFLLPLLPVALKTALSKQDHASVGHVVAIMSQFAFDAETKAKLQKQKEIQQILEMVIAQANLSADWTSTAHDAEGLLWTLRGGDKISGTGKVRNDQIMISYNWAHKQVAMKLHTFFANQGFKVWRDDDHIKANLMESMAEAVLESVAVVLLVSPQYKESANCQREATFASNKGKKIIPLLVVEGYVGDGWLGLLIAPMIYYDVTKDFEGTLHRMVTHEFQNAVKPNGSSSRQSHQIPFTSPLASLKTVQDVVEFIQSRPGLEDLAEKFRAHEIDGPAVRSIIKHWNAGTLHFTEVQNWFGITSVGKLFKLKSVLDGQTE